MLVEVVQNNRVLSRYLHGGRIFVEAPPSGEYSIRISNPSSSRRLAVVSVDGRNVIDGEKAGFDGPGYVLRGFEVLEIPGWRRSDSQVAKFEFQPQDKSYVAAIGDGVSNTGVIGVAVFEEREAIRSSSSWGVLRSMGFRHISKELYSTDSSIPSGDNSRSVSLNTGTKSTQLGTGYGSEGTLHTSETNFKRAYDTPSQVITVQYAVRETLIGWGVPVMPVIPTPEAFPQRKSVSVKAPPGWRG